MALLCALSLFTVLVLALAAIGLYLDTRGDRRARRAWEHATEARLTGHDAQLTILGRAVAALVEPKPAPLGPPPSTAREPRKGPTRPPIDLGTMTEAERSRGLTVEMARPAALPLRVVPVTRDDDPIYTRPTVEQLPKATAEGDRESAEELTRVMVAGERPTVEDLGLGPFPEMTGSQDETPPRRAGLYSIVREVAPEDDPPPPLTPTKPSRRGE